MVFPFGESLRLGCSKAWERKAFRPVYRSNYGNCALALVTSSSRSIRIRRNEEEPLMITEPIHKTSTYMNRCLHMYMNHCFPLSDDHSLAAFKERAAASKSWAG